MALAAERPQTEAAASPAAAGAAARPIIFRERFQILPGNPLPDLDTPSSRAYLAEDRRDGKRALYALIASPTLPTRINVIGGLRATSIKGLLPLIEGGTIDWPMADRRTVAVVYDRPLGGRVVEALAMRSGRITEQDIARRVAVPLIHTLERMQMREFTHRAIRPDNIFYVDKLRQELVLGDCVTTPPGYDQHIVFETIERGMAQREGRGTGTLTEDIYALGVTMLFLYLGNDPVLKMGDDEIIRSKIEKGTFHTLVGRESIPPVLLEPLRGMMADDLGERWGLTELENWVSGRRHTPPPRKSAAKTDAGFEFAGGVFFSPRMLASAMCRNVREAAQALKQSDGRFEIWMRRATGSQQRGDTLVAVVREALQTTGDEPVSDDLLVARVAILLDPTCPIRYKNLSFMPDGFGPVVCAELAQTGLGEISAEALTRELPTFWLNYQTEQTTAGTIATRQLAQVRNFLLNNDIGYGIERVLYEMNRGAPCQSTTVSRDNVIEIFELLPALDAAAKRVDPKTRPIDRHVAAFIGARYNQDVSSTMQALAMPDHRSVAAATLSLFSLLQGRLQAGPLFGLAGWIGAHLGPAIAAYHSRSTRREIERELPRLIRQGIFEEMYDFVESKDKRKYDADGYRSAIAEYAAARAEIQGLQGKVGAAARRAEEAGQQTAAMAAITVMLIVVAIFMFA